MAEEPTNAIRRTGSLPLQGSQSRLRHRGDFLQEFADNSSHIRPQNRDRVQFVDIPEFFDSYEFSPGYPFGHASSPNLIAGTSVEGDRYARQYAYGRPMPTSQCQDPPASTVYTTPLPSQGLINRSTADLYASGGSHYELDELTRHTRGKTRVNKPNKRERQAVFSDSGNSSTSNPDDHDGAVPTISYPSRSRSSRSKLGHRLYYQSSFNATDSDDDQEGYDEDLGGKVFQFVPSKASKALSKSGHSDDTEVSLEKSVDGPPLANDGLNGTGTSSIFHIFRSQYTGDAVLDGTHGAKLTIIHDPKKQRPPLFRWMHLEQRMMNLDELSAEISRIPVISDSERNGFAKLLTEVKRNRVKVRPTSNGNGVRHMDPKPVRVTIPPDGRTKEQTSRSLTWLCVPYFSLEKYSGLLSASTASSFPIETLLQSEYARTTKERDMQQAVCQNGEVPDGFCFHIAQLWCLVLDNTLLITCGRMPHAALRGDLVRIVNEPLKEPSGKGKMIYVTYYECVLWQLPLESCSTWFEFIMHFREFWPQVVKVFHNDHAITETDWPRIINMVKHVNNKVVLDLRLWHHPHPPPVGVLRTLTDEARDTTRINTKTANHSSQNAKSKPNDSVNNNFHVFTWLGTTEKEANDTESETEVLVTHLREVEDYLLRSTTMRDRDAYNKCRLSSRCYVHAYLKAREIDINKVEGDSRENREYESMIDIYNAADIVFSFFLPYILDKDTPTIGKFWGPICSLIEMSNEDSEVWTHQAKQARRRSSANIRPLRSALRGLTRTIQSFQDIMSHASALIQSRIEVPDALVRAWLHLIMALIQASTGDVAWIENMNVVEALIRKGMNDIMEELPVEDLLSNSIVQPMELVALISMKLLQDSTGAYPNITDTYSDYLKGLENEITANNSDRSHQHRIALFGQEITVIKRVIVLQIKTINGMTVPHGLTWWERSSKENEMLEREREKSKADTVMQRSREKHGTAYVDRMVYEYSGPYHRTIIAGLRQFGPLRDPDAFSKLASTDPGGFRELLGHECRSWLERRGNEFEELELEASRLENMNTNKIEVTKDRQEAAVYAFTMVTIIFLPLSTVSSIFGMNSSDLRDMEAGQWMYWATALPTTAAVIITGLWWMGALHNMADWLRGLPPSSWSSTSRRNKGYAQAKPPAAAAAQDGVIYYPPEGGYPPALEPPPQAAIRPYSRAATALGPPVPPRASWR